jgi:hypothetical protein
LLGAANRRKVAKRDQPKVNASHPALPG